MFYYRIIIRYIIGTGAALYIIGLLIDSFNGNPYYGMLYISFMYSFFFEFPAIILFLIVSVCNYLITKRFWSVFKIEYYFLLSRLGLFVLVGLIYFIAEQLK